MVYLKELIRQKKERLLEERNIELVAYLSISFPQEINKYEFDLSPEEDIALLGYKGEHVDTDKVTGIVSKQPVKGIDATSNIYKFSGLYLAAKSELTQLFEEKYNTSDIKQKFFLTKINSQFINSLKKEVEATTDSESTTILIKKILDTNAISEGELQEAVLKIAKLDFDVQTQIILEDLVRALLKVGYCNKSAEEVVRDILLNFSNAVQKIVRNRRSGHEEFKIADEYDVQDILYVILKSVFPMLRDEDPIPKVGAKSTKIDFILRDEGILVEVKMLKSRDVNETEFIEQLKKDIESYHQCQWLKKLFCFVYDPNRKTRDLINFSDLNGDRTKNAHSFNVEVIVAQ